MSGGERQSRSRRFDWDAARDRLARAIAATERAIAGTPDDAHEVMKARARALAHTPEAEAVDRRGSQAVTFVLGNERHAIEARYVREVVPFVDFTPVPGAADFVVGVANLRGAIVAVFDMRRFVNVARKGVTDLRRMVVVGVERVEFGILVDDIGEVVDLDLGALNEPLGAAQDDTRRLLRGVTEDALAVIDGEALLADERFLIHRNAGSPR